MNDRLAAFVGGDDGTWGITHCAVVRGPLSLPAVRRLAVHAEVPAGTAGRWAIRGVTSNLRYTERAERDALVARQEGLGRPAATRAAMIPIRKSPAWWDLPQDERRAILEERSRHIAVGMEYLPSIARRLYHCRDLGEPFDFVTWFEYAPEHAPAFEELVRRLRASAEWEYVDAEIDLRLMRE